MTCRLMLAAICLAFTLPASGLLQQVTAAVSVSSQGNMLRPGAHGSKGHAKKHKKRKLKHHSRHRSRKSDSFGEKTSRANCVAWKDASYSNYPNDALYQYEEFATKSDADAFFQEKKDFSPHATIQYADGELADKHGSYHSSDAYNMALVCGISLNSTTPWSTKTVCDADEVVDSMAECQLAGPFLGFKYKGYVSTDDGSTPPGCHSVAGESFYNMVSSVEATEGTAIPICRVTAATTTLPALAEQPAESFVSSDEPAPIVRRARPTEGQAGQTFFHGRRHGAKTARNHHVEEQHKETNADALPSWVAGLSGKPALPKSMQTDPTLSGISGMPALPKSMQPEPTVPKMQPPPSFRSRASRSLPKQQESETAEEDAEAKRAANAVKVLQELQELKMQMELKMLAKKMQGGNVETTTAAAQWLKAEANETMVKATTTAAPQMFKVETTSTVVHDHPALKEQPKACGDANEFCGDWASKGECDKNPLYMKVVCKAACGHCKEMPQQPVLTQAK